MPTDTPDVLRLADIGATGLVRLLAEFGLKLEHCPANQPIPHSYWGEQEAGLKYNRLYARDDTPLHSILHEVGHYTCMTPGRRAFHPARGLPFHLP